MLYKKKKILSGLSSIALSLLLFTGCGSTSAEIPSDAGSASNESQSDSYVLRYAVASSPKGLFSPLLSNTTYDNNSFHHPKEHEGEPQQYFPSRYPVP